MTKKPDTCTILAMQYLRSVAKAPPEKRDVLKRRAKVWLTLAKERRRDAQKH